jgi:hypothetical protein
MPAVAPIWGPIGTNCWACIAPALALAALAPGAAGALAAYRHWGALARALAQGSSTRSLPA